MGEKLWPSGTDLLELSNYKVEDDGDDGPVLLTQDGRPVDTWREWYPVPGARGEPLGSSSRAVAVGRGRAGACIRVVSSSGSASPGEQRARFRVRPADPVGQWKRCPRGLASVDKWPDYTGAEAA